MSEVALRVNGNGETDTRNAVDLITLPEQIEQLASQGMTIKQIAGCLGVSRNTLYNRFKSDGDTLDAIKRGRARGIAEVTRNLKDNAANMNTAAQIFYLKNRSPEEWKDRRETEVSATVEHVNQLGKVEVAARLLGILEQAADGGSGEADTSGDGDMGTTTRTTD